MAPTDGKNALTGPACFICGGTLYPARTSAYQRCGTCGHEILTEDQSQSYIVNDQLSQKEIKRWTQLDKFKRRVLFRCDPKPPHDAQWVDVGSASGKYLYQNQNRYAQAQGLEITPEALAFSRNVLGLNIVQDVDQVMANTHVATAWHSLEHFPVSALEKVLSTLAAGMTTRARFIVSVPNANSFQYRWFRNSYAFFDVPNHLHQFTPQSLDRMMARFGFKLTSKFASWPYNTFGYTQGLLNRFTGTHNYLYYRVKRRCIKPSLRLDLLHVMLLPFLVPIGWCLGVLDAMRLESQGVITVCYEKNPC